jgi:hypothetical protein
MREMAFQLEQKAVQTVAEYVNVVEEWLSTTTNSGLWFRGMASHTSPLRPSLYRHPTRNDVIALEKDVSGWFSQRSPPFCPVGLTDFWEKTFYMQHYGFPTRLLDWSESPLVALYFALRDSTIQSVGVDPPTGIWVLDPVGWNQAFHQKNRVISVSDDFLRGYNLQDRELSQARPVAMSGIHNSQRISAQRGVFTIFGTERQSMDEMLASVNLQSNNVLRRVTIAAADVDPMRQMFGRFGMTPSTIMQDINSLSVELREAFKF